MRKSILGFKLFIYVFYNFLLNSFYELDVFYSIEVVIVLGVIEFI